MTQESFFMGEDRAMRLAQQVTARFVAQLFSFLEMREEQDVVDHLIGSVKMQNQIQKIARYEALPAGVELHDARAKTAVSTIMSSLMNDFPKSILRPSIRQQMVEDSLMQWAEEANEEMSESNIQVTFRVRVELRDTVVADMKGLKSEQSVSNYLSELKLDKVYPDQAEVFIQYHHPIVPDQSYPYPPCLR